MSSKRIRLEYFDQNEAFGRALPPGGAVGTLTRQLGLKDWGDNWHLLELDEPFSYEGRLHTRVLIRSRWEGREIGEPDATSVFILLVPDAAVLELPLPAPEAFDHVAWGMAHTLAVA